jgi:hypothetical protein
MKFLSEKGVRTKTQEKCNAVQITSLLGVENHKLAVILDWQSAGSTRLLAEVSLSLTN